MGEEDNASKMGKAFVPQLLMAGRAKKGALELETFIAGKCSNYHRQGSHRNCQR